MQGWAFSNVSGFVIHFYSWLVAAKKVILKLMTHRHVYTLVWLDYLKHQISRHWIQTCRGVFESLSTHSREWITEWITSDVWLPYSLEWMVMFHRIFSVFTAQALLLFRSIYSTHFGRLKLLLHGSPLGTFDRFVFVQQSLHSLVSEGSVSYYWLCHKLSLGSN